MATFLDDLIIVYVVSVLNRNYYYRLCKRYDRVFSWRVPVSCLLSGSSRVFDAYPEREPGEPVNLLFSRQYSIM